MELLLSIVGAVTVTVTAMYGILRLGAFCEGREW